jgi:hypothetical protein
MMRIFLNGVEVASRAQTGPIEVSDGLLRIGGNNGKVFNGLIDEVRIYNRALTEAQIQVDMNTPVPNATPNPVPATSEISPSSAPAGSVAFTLSVNGSDFVPSSVVKWNGADRVTTFVSSSQLTAQVLASDVAAEGTAQVTVFNPAPAGGTSNSQTFTITPAADNPVPTTTGINPSSVAAGSTGFTLVVTGTGFVGSSVVRWNSVDRPTTFVSDTQLMASITSFDITTPGTAQVTVSSPTPGGGLSNAQTFIITNPVPVISGISPSSRKAGQKAFTLTVSGTNFVSGAVIRWNGADRLTTFVSSSQLTAAIPDSDIATPGTVSVTVFNPAPGGGLSNTVSFTVR